MIIMSKVGIVAGSLRKSLFQENRRQCSKTVSEGYTTEMIEFGNLPLYRRSMMKILQLIHRLSI